jgi:hypothetical protein
VGRLSLVTFSGETEKVTRPPWMADETPQGRESVFVETSQEKKTRAKRRTKTALTLPSPASGRGEQLESSSASTRGKAIAEHRAHHDRAHRAQRRRPQKTRIEAAKSASAKSAQAARPRHPRPPIPRKVTGSAIISGSAQPPPRGRPARATRACKAKEIIE